MSEPLNILVIEGSNTDFLMIERHLKQKGLPVRYSRVDTLEGLKEAIDRENWDLVLSDYNIPQLNFVDSINLIWASLTDLPVIIVSGIIGEEKAVELLKLGVCDFVLKDNMTRLVPAIERSLKDASEQKAKRASDLAMKKSEIRFRSIFNKSPVAIGIGKCDSGQLIDVNDAWLQLYGYERDEVIGRTTSELNLFSRPEDRTEIIRLIGECGMVMNREVQLRHKTGEKLVALLSAELVEMNGESFLQAMLTDITRQKRTENALRVSEERFHLAMRGTDEGLWDWNTKLEEMYYAPRWKTMLGYADNELVNHLDTWKRLLHPDDLEAVTVFVRDFLKEHATNFSIEVRMRHKEGHYLNILSRGFPIYDDLGQAVRVVGTNVDITERMKLEEQLRQSQKIEAVGQLAGGVAHDFNNILSAILGYSHLILDRENIGDTTKKYVNEIVAASNRAADLTRSLLAFSRKQPVSLAVIDLNEVMKGNGEFLRRLIREDIELKINCTGEPLTVLADRGQIEQVLMNLVANARDAMPNGGMLLIETMPATTLDREFFESHGYGDSGTYNLISVSDSGEGMDKETQKHIFEPFFTTKEQGKGTGLGLSMAYGIVKKHHGFITVYSEPGEGTIFKIYLPRMQATAPVEEMVREEQSSPRGGTETILVGEDDDALRRLSARVLSHFGYRVIEAVDGQDAVDKFIEHGDSIHLVILDAIMPKKNGRDACREMRMVRPDLKAVFVSGYARDIFADGDDRNGNAIFIQKPYAPNDLVAKVRELLDKK